MFESLDYTTLLNRMLANAQAFYPNSDTRVGSVIYTTIAPAAIELESVYIELDRLVMESFAETSTREFLIKRCAERGITPKPAVKAVFKGEFDVSVPIGTRFSLDTYSYVVKEVIDEAAHQYKVECEQYGAEPNTVLGDLIALDYVENLTSAKITELITAGEDEEATEALRERYFDSINSTAFGGNVADYKQRLKTLNDVGLVKVTPTPNNVGGTVGIVFLAEDGDIPTPSQVATVQNEVNAFAPIGHSVTVAGATAVPINITATLTYTSDKTWNDVKDDVLLSLDYYFKALTSDWENGNQVVRVTGIEQSILSTEGVLDITDTKINGGTSNIELQANQIAVRGTVNGV